MKKEEGVEKQQCRKILVFLLNEVLVGVLKGTQATLSLPQLGPELVARILNSRTRRV